MQSIKETVSNAASTAIDALKNPMSKSAQLEQFRSHPGKDTHMKGPFGQPIAEDKVALRAGERGPTLLEDRHLREKINAFDHERIPERIVHARGAAAHGHFKLHTPIPEITYAQVLNDTSLNTDTFVRFSTVSGSRGSADSVRDVRGFATRFYTQQGNWDIVGNNIPIFFIQQAIQFPDLVHALKPEPNNEIPQAQTAHDNAWDWMGLSPQSTAMQMWILSDRTIPRSYAMMQGFGVHSFVAENSQGKLHFVKFHWKPHLGIHSLVWDEALKLAGQNPDFHRQDLWERIDSGAFPKWEFGVQAVPIENEHDFSFDLLDSTKLIPEEQVPVKWIGTLTLDRNTDDYFAETEQVGFGTQNLVPGLQHSDDPLLQGRSFSYQDTQLSRLGSINWPDLPINRPVCPVFNNIRDGHMRYKISTGKINYFPNREQLVPTVPKSHGGYLEAMMKIEGFKTRAESEKFKEYYSQAQLFYNSMTEVEKQHIIAAASFELGKCDDVGVQQRVIDNMARVDIALATKVAENLDLKPAQPESKYENKGERSQFLSQVTGEHTSYTASGRKVGIVLADGFNVAGATALKAAFTAKGVIPVIIGPRKGKVNSGETSFDTQFTFETSRSTLFDALYFPGGDSSYDSALKTGRLLHFAREAYGHFKTIGAAGSAVKWLTDLALPNEIIFTNKSVSSTLPQDGIITAEETTPDVISLFLQEVSKHRAWNRDVSLVAV